MYETPLTGLVLSGGGARAAYQVGVLRAHGPHAARRAGADGAAAQPLRRDRAAPRPAPSTPRRWPAMPTASKPRWKSSRGSGRTSSAEQVYRADSLGVIRSGAQWLTMLSLGWAIARWRKARPRSLLDNGRWPNCCSAWCRWSGCR
jgi:NTE family protein